MYKLKGNKDGKTIGCMFQTGNDFVKTTISMGSAENMIKNNELLESDLKDYPICVQYKSHKWFFPGTKVKEKEKEETSEEKTEDE